LIPINTIYKAIVIFKEGTDEKIDLLWDSKFTAGNPKPKPTEDKTKYYPIIKEG